LCPDIMGTMRISAFLIYKYVKIKNMTVHPQISWREWRRVVIMVFIVMGVTLVPYIYGYATTPSDKVYTGIRLNNFPDTNSYLSWIEQGRELKPLFKQLNSSELQPALLFHPIFFATGVIARILSFPNVVAYHTVRFAAGVIFLLIGYYFLAHFVEKQQRFFSFIMFATASGLGWLIFPSADITQIEATNFLNLYESLLNPISLAVMLLIFLQFIKSGPNSFKKQFVLLALLSNLLILIHSYDFIVVAAVLGVYSFYVFWSSRSRQIVRLYLYMIAVSFPAALWQVYVLQHNPVLGVWATLQSHVPFFPSLAFYAIGGGLPLILTFIAFGFIIEREQFDRYSFLVIWLAAAVFLLFNPIFGQFQRKLSIGLFIPLNILASIGLAYAFEPIKLWPRLRKILVGIVVLVMTFTNFYVMWVDILYLRADSSPLYISRTQQQAMAWVKERISEDQVLLTGAGMGNLIPGQTGKAVYLGHYDQTVNFNSKYDLEKKILAQSPRATDPLRTFAKINSINYLVVDDEVRSWGSFNAADHPFLKLVYQNPDVQIYQVQL
jgi:hypothetical protein